MPLMAATDVSHSAYQRFAFRMVALFTVLGVVLALVAIQVYRTVGDFIAAGTWIAHTYEVKQQITQTIVALRDAEGAQRAYVIGGNASRLADYYAALPRLTEHVAHLRQLVADNPDQAGSAKQFEGLLGGRQALMSEAFDAYQKGGIESLRSDARFAQAREQDAEIDALAGQMLALEGGLLAEREASSAAKADLTRLLTVGAIVLCFAMLAVALIVVLREQKRRIESERRVTSSYGDLARSLEEARRLSDTLRQLSDLGEMLQGCRSLEEAATGLRSVLANLFPAADGSINLVNASQNLLAPVGTWGNPIQGEPVFAPDDCWAVRRGRAYPEEEARTVLTCKHLADGRDDAAMNHLCVPLLAQGTMLGTLLLRTDKPIPRETRDVAIAAAEQISLAVANLKLQDTLRTQSLRDPLTGLFNRRYLEASLARDVALAIRRNQPLAVLMIDIDHFKQFNDGHGHDAGDALLAAFGELLSSLVRSEDVACRYGGEEFTVVMQETDAAQALDRAEEIRRATHTFRVEHRRQSLDTVTVSVGIASYPQHGDTPDHLLRRADRALYIAKNGGRDQVCVADR
jgi:diguanylate cyclase (GGDEF)-like protein